MCLKFAVRGQYQGYKNEDDVDKDSKTETFAAMKLFIDTQRFKGVPFYLRAGKMMPKSAVYVSMSLYRLVTFCLRSTVARKSETF